MNKEKQESQVEVDERVLGFWGNRQIKGPEDLAELRKFIQDSFLYREYNEESEEQEKSIRWQRTASEIIRDGYVYKGKACSDLSIVFLALCRAAGLEGNLVKLVSLDGTSTHSLVEVKIDDTWFRLDVTMKDGAPFTGQLQHGQIWNKNWQGGWKVWKRGRDLWDMGLKGIEDEDKIYNKDKILD